MAPLSEPLLYFLAGSLLPSLAYFFLLRNKNNEARMMDNDDDYESSDDDDNTDEAAAATTDCKSWGLRHAPYKMVLCVNTDLKMGKGKIAAQCGHAALGAYKSACRKCPTAVRTWERTGCAKIAVKITQDDMSNVAALARSRGIPLYLVEDAGRTQIAAGSRTVLGLGPAPVAVFQGVSDHLKLM